MKKIFVGDIRERDQVDTVFLVKEKTAAMAKNGKPYLTLRLMDKSGDIEGRVWDNVDVLTSRFVKDDFVAIRSKASVYLGKMQLIISELARVPEEEVVLADFLPEAARDIEEMAGELRSLVDSLNDPHLGSLLRLFIDDPAFLARYRVAPAAKGMHHVYLGGLLEHSLAVARLVDAIIPLYEGLNRDLLVAGALLHDVGKVREMTYVRSFDYTDEGKLLGHITMGVEMVHEKIALLPGFPPELAMLLKHMILAHHGQYEFGSPKRPKTVEATILNYLDDLDSKINGIRTHIDKELEGTRWSSYHRLYDRYFFMDNGVKTVREPAEEEPVPVAAPPVPPEKPKKNFGNNPFETLKDRSLFD